MRRDEAGRLASVIYPNKASTKKPEYEMRYEYAADGRIAETALVRMWEADTSEYGPERFVVQYIYDKGGRLVRKVVRDNSVQDSAVRYETSYEFDGMGRMTRERVLKRVEESGVERMNVLEEKRTTYDLGNNPTEVKFYDNVGWAYTETRSYARGYQLIDFSTQAAQGVTVSTSGSYTYDTNNNLTGTKKLDVKRGATQLAYRAQWTFTYDRKNRLKSHTNTNASNVRGNLWYDGRGRVWQRWNDNSVTEEWDATLKRFVYDGGALVQEHELDVAEVSGEWVYTYSDLTRDYLRHAAGVRQRQRSGGNDTDYYLEANSGALEFKTERDPVAEAIARTERTASLNQISGATFTSGLSNLATTNNYIEMYGGGTSGSPAGFDALIQRRGPCYLAGLGVFANMSGSQPQTLENGPVTAPAELLGPDPSVISGTVSMFPIIIMLGLREHCVTELEAEQLSTTGCDTEYCQGEDPEGTAIYHCAPFEACVMHPVGLCWCICRLTFEYDLYQVYNYGGPYTQLTYHCIANRRLTGIDCRDSHRRAPCHSADAPCPPATHYCTDLNGPAAHYLHDSRSYQDRCAGTCHCNPDIPGLPQRDCGCEDALAAAAADCARLSRHSTLFD